MANGEAVLPILRICNYCATQDSLKECIRCGKLYCFMHSATFSPNFCQDCFKNFGAVWDKFIRTTTEYDPVSNSVYHLTKSSDRVRMDGPDYVFYTRWINKISDDDLEQVYEFHYFILKLIEHENEIRKIKHNRALQEKYKGIPIGILTTKETRSRREIKQKDMQAELERLGLPKPTVMAMCAAAGITYVEKGA